jgi:hypothetical protein
MKHIAVTRRIGPGGFLAGTQPGAGVSNRVIGSQSLRLQIQQMDGPGIAIALSFGGEQVAVGRSDVDAGKHRLRALEKFVVQADAHR